MSGPAVPELATLGRELEAALRARAVRRRWWPAGRVTLVLAVCAAVAVPAAATSPLWAPLIRGETALPQQTPRELRVAVASGTTITGHAWQLVAYRARLRDGGGGVCLYLVAAGAGSGACRDRQGRRLAVVEDTTTGESILHSLLPERVARVELTLRGGAHLVVVPHRHRLPRAEGRPTESILVMLVELGTSGSRPRLLGARALDGRGRELARSGRPSPAPTRTPTVFSPSYRRSR